MKNILLSILLLNILSWDINGQSIKPIYPIPSSKQLNWQALEYYGFVHFNMNTFTNVEWGEGKEDPRLFNPSALDCAQWVRIAKAAGMKGLILTAKHHDGFALYPSKYTEHSVKKSPWKQGKGDVVRELANACKKQGLKLGIYLSPWDRFHPAYGTESYNQVYANMQKELLTQYGPIFEFWYDGANGEGPNGKKQVYDWKLFHSVVNKYQPQAVQFSDNGPDIRWVGNERGYSYETMWSPINKDEIYPGYPKFDDYRNGQEQGSHWVAPEVDVSLRPGWYYHPDQDSKVKSPDSLMRIYVASVGRNANLLINIPVDTRGLIHPNDSAALMGLRDLMKEGLKSRLIVSDKFMASSSVHGHPVQLIKDGSVSSFWAALQKDIHPTIQWNTMDARLANAVLLQEPIALGQRVKRFVITITDDSNQIEKLTGFTIGNKRIIPFKARKIKSIQVDFLDARGQVLLSNFDVLNITSTRNESLYH
ncbi:alpha-L-fucosidase [Aquirufa regiilacus]|uniref:alpha-L-fucosidase n=1 Tax=Aquirufa regiilacus TaxID=3024868 RepID=A0ABU3TQL9_9BACT|nr:alpha-L-fucosidase [Aquirufa sp. LEOWEIH-7C]MDU0808150.1 alpha-L-fucosidase [Aquirufa sp. LEOWEIH-7C]